MSNDSSIGMIVRHPDYTEAGIVLALDEDGLAQVQFADGEEGWECAKELVVDDTDFVYAWLNDERTRLSVRYIGEVPTVYDPDGNEVEDAGSITWPNDGEVSATVGRAVEFADAGDDLCEAIFHAVAVA